MFLSLCFSANRGKKDNVERNRVRLEHFKFSIVSIKEERKNE